MDQAVTPQDKLYIGGEWRRGRGAEIASNFPADGSLNANLPGASIEDVDLAIERGKQCQSLLCKRLDRDGIVDIEHDRVHIGSPGNGFLKRIETPPGNNHGIAQIMQPLCQRRADAAAATGDQKSVALRFHATSPIGGARHMETPRWLYTPS